MGKAVRGFQGETALFGLRGALRDNPAVHGKPVHETFHAEGVKLVKILSAQNGVLELPELNEAVEGSPQDYGAAARVDTTEFPPLYSIVDGVDEE